MKRTIALTGLALALLLGACRQEETPEREPAARPVRLLEVAAGGDASRSFPGRVMASNQVDLSFRVGGPLIELPVSEGELVRQGQLLARIDPRDFQIRLNAAKADFERTEADFNRFTILYERDAISLAQLDQSRAARNVALAAVDDAEAALADTRLLAPFGSLVGERFVENFQHVRPQQPIVSLIDVRNLDIEVDFPESVAAQYASGREHEAFARFETAPGREFELRLKEAATQADPRTQTFRVTFTMPQPEGINLLPGMTATVTLRIGIAATQGVVIPIAAIFSDETRGTYVWVVERAEMMVSKRAVVTGEPVGTSEVEILNGLEVGETIATSAVSRLSEGMRIRELR